MTTTTNSVKETVSKICSDIYHSLISAGEAKSDESIHAEIIGRLKADFGDDELVEAFLVGAVQSGWKAKTKHGSIGAILSKTKHGDLFPAELDDANISLEGLTVPFRKAEIDIVERQERAYIDNSIAQQKAFARNMDVVSPILSMMKERGVTAGEAMDILRGRK